MIATSSASTSEISAAGSYLKVSDGAEAASAMRLVMNDPAFATEMATIGRRAVLDRHTCAHRADELLALIAAQSAAHRSVTTKAPDDSDRVAVS